MILKKMGVIAGVCLCSMLFLTGCSFSDLLDRWMGTAVESTGEASASTSSGAEEPPKTVDSNLETPVFVSDLGGTVQMTVGSTCTLHVEASVGDGGTVTYQWYSNNVDSNGGGTILEGATSDSYTVDTSAAGTTYYYVVAANNHGESIALGTSSVQAVTVWEPGQWVQEADSTWSYQLTDGTHPASTWMDIEGQTYYFNDSGRRVTGWVTIGDTEYYFNENGELQRNASTPDGAATDENGARVSE